MSDPIINTWTPCAPPLLTSATYGGLGQVLVDDALDLLWVSPAPSTIWNPLANVDGHHKPVQSYALGYNGFQPEATMLRYTSTAFKSVPRIAPAHPRADSAKSGGGILATSPAGVVNLTNTGQVEWICPSSSEVDFDGLAIARMGAQVVATCDAGQAVHVLDCFAGKPLRRVDMKDEGGVPITHLARLDSNSLCVGSSSGQIRLIDTRQARPSSKGMLAHSAQVTRLIVSGNTICTTGWSLKLGRVARDPIIKVFDARMMGSDSKLTMLRAVTWPAISQPADIHFNPRATNAIFALGDTGTLASIDLVRPEKSQWVQADLLQQSPDGMLNVAVDPGSTRMASLGVHPDAQVLVLGQEDGIVQFYSNIQTELEPGRNIPFAFENFVDSSKRRVEWPVTSSPPVHVPWNEDGPLSLIGLPYYDQPLLSTFSNGFYTLNALSCMRRPPVRIPDEVTSKLKIAGNGVASAPYPTHMKGHRYVVQPLDQTSDYRQSKFRSEQIKKIKAQTRSQTPTNVHLDGSDTDTVAEKVPKATSIPQLAWNQRVEMKYSRFGIGDFDFDYYNKTNQSGLESHTTDAYANALIQALFHVPILQDIVRAHTNDNCSKVKCLCCELGFLCSMLRDGKGAHCQATNFGTTLNATPGADRLGLTDPEYSVVPPAFGNLIQTLNRFLFSALASDCLPFTPKGSLTGLSDVRMDAISQVLGFTLVTTVTCACGAQSRKEPAHQHVLDIQYNFKSSNETPTFARLLEDSIVRETSAKQNCTSCKTLAMHRSRRILANSMSFPAVLSINTNTSQRGHSKLWQTENFMPEHIFIGPSGAGGLSVRHESTLDKMDTNFAKYSLRSVIWEFTDSLGTYLVTIARGSGPDEWYAFNDFLVQPIEMSSAMRAHADKTPSVLFYERTDMTLNTNALNTQLNTEILLTGSSPRTSFAAAAPDIKTLLPTKGTHIAIDAEFVSLQQEEYALRSNGDRSILRPSRMALARVSVVTSDGRVLIDDYISLSEPIVDHLTEFSGINPGDLNPKTSPYTLVPLKTAYKKIRLLLDLGCIFIGHGLINDFRILNIFVPPAQIIDTVEIYYKADQQRKLSLKFLTWYVLKQNIQIDTHDSVEDARGALQLWQRYMELKAKREWDAALDDIFTQGRLCNFKVQ